MRRLSDRWQRIGHMMIGTGLLQGASIITYVLLARLLDQADYGTYRQLFLTAQVVWGVFFSALPTALLFFAGRAGDKAEIAAVVRRHLGVVSFVAVGAAAILAVAASPIAAVLNNAALVELLPIFALYPASFMFATMVAPSLIALQQTATLPYFTGTLALINSVPVIVAAAMGASMPVIAMTVSASGVAAGLLALALLHRVTLSARPGKALPRRRAILIYATPLLAAGGVALIGLRIDQIAVSNAFGAAAFAVYAAGAFELPFYSLVKSSTTSVMLPELSRSAEARDWNQVNAVWHDLQSKSAALILPVSAALFAFAGDFIITLFGVRYRGAGPIFAIFCLLGPIRVLSAGLILRAMGNTRTEFVTSSLYLCVSAVAVFLAAGTRNLEAVAIAAVLSVWFIFFVTLYLSARYSSGGLTVLRLFPMRILATYGALIALFAAFAFALREIDVPVMARVLAAGALAVPTTLWLIRHRNVLRLQEAVPEQA